VWVGRWRESFPIRVSGGRSAASAAKGHAVAPISVSSTPRPRVSLTMIVRNEEHHLPGCLASVRALADEIVIVDTGSTDRTKAIALSFGAKVFDVPWQDSFAAARNAAIERSTGEWILSMDADDRLNAADRDLLAAFLPTLGTQLAAFVMTNCCHGAPGEIPTFLDQVRLFPNRPNHRWVYRVHEQIVPSLIAGGCEICRLPIGITHIGYADPAARWAKVQRNIRLAELDRQERPGDPVPLLHLGAAAIELGDLNEGTRLLEESLRLAGRQPSRVARVFALLAEAGRRAKDLPATLRWCQAGRSWFPDDPELLFREAAALREMGDLASAEARLRQLLTIPENPSVFGNGPVGLRGPIGRGALASLLLEAGRPLEAIVEWTQAIEQEPSHLPSQCGLAETLMRLGRWSDLERQRTKLASMGSEGAEAAASFHVRSLLARGDLSGAQKVADDAVQQFPNSVPIRVLRTHPLLMAKPK
jgi:tetratricopeptide (TPR) repeat protein